MPKRIKAKLIGKGTLLDPIRVNLPSYVMDVERDAEGNPVLSPAGEPVAQDLEGKTWCWVLVPDDEVGPDGRLDEKRIREKYRERWSKFRREDVEPEE